MDTHQDVPGNRAAPRILGTSPRVCQLHDEIRRVAPFSTSVLIMGPSGTGKELVAREIHAQSPRRAEPMIPVDCASISGELMASQLFGHREGAFTGANYNALGCFRAADRGTIFLDEIGELQLSLQSRLLRVLQERVVVPVGGHDGVPIDVRVISATNRDLRQEVAASRFREDLFFRLNVVTIHTVALADRPEDIRELAENILAQLVIDGLPSKSISPGAMESLEHFSWPGNVRQLRNVLEQAVIQCDGPLIALPLIQNLLAQCKTGSKPSPTDRNVGLPAVTQSVPVYHGMPSGHLSATAGADEQWSTLATLERRHVICTLEHTYYNQSAAARLLGITRQALIRKMKKFGLNVPTRKNKSDGTPPHQPR